MRVHLGGKSRPSRLERVDENGHGERVWEVEIIARADLETQGKLTIGMETGSIHGWQPV